MGITQKDMAEYLGIAASTVSQKVNNVRPMDLSEAEKIAEMLKIPDNEFGEYQGRKNFAGEIMREMEKTGFDQGEAEIFLKLLEGMMKENIEQPTKRRVFRVSGDHANCQCGHEVAETDNFCGRVLFLLRSLQ